MRLTEAEAADVRRMLAEIAGGPVCLAELPDGRPCLRNASVQIEIGCVHEHVSTETVCERCAEVALAGGGLCRYCEAAGCHGCVLAGRRAS